MSTIAPDLDELIDDELREWMDESITLPCQLKRAGNNRYPKKDLNQPCPDEAAWIMYFRGYCGHIPNAGSLLICEQHKRIIMAVGPICVDNGPALGCQKPTILHIEPLKDTS